MFRCQTRFLIVTNMESMKAEIERKTEMRGHNGIILISAILLIFSERVRFLCCWNECHSHNDSSSWTRKLIVSTFMFVCGLQRADLSTNS